MSHSPNEPKNLSSHSKAMAAQMAKLRATRLARNEKAAAAKVSDLHYENLSKDRVRAAEEKYEDVKRHNQDDQATTDQLGPNPVNRGCRKSRKRKSRRRRRRSRRKSRKRSRRSRRIGGLRKFNKTRRIPAPHYLLSPEEEGALQRVRNPPPASDRILSSSPSRSSLRKKRGLRSLPSVKARPRMEIYASPIGATKIAADAEKRRLRSIKDLYIQRVTNEKRLKKAREHASAQPPKDSLINSLIKKINPIFDLAT